MLKKIVDSHTKSVQNNFLCTLSAWLFNHAVCKIGLYKRYFSVHLSTKVLCSPFKQQSKSHMRPKKKVKQKKSNKNLIFCFITILEFFLCFRSLLLFFSLLTSLFRFEAKKIEWKANPARRELKCKERWNVEKQNKAK